MKEFFYLKTGKCLVFSDRDLCVKGLVSFGELNKILSYKEKMFSMMRTISPMGMMKMDFPT